MIASRCQILLKSSNSSRQIASRLYVSQMNLSQLSNSEIELTKKNQVGYILLNRPKQLNAMNLSMVKQMQKQIEHCENDKDIKCIMVKGSGETAFCAGGDVKTIRDNCISGSRSKAMEFFREEYKLNYQIANCKKPYIALINGVTMGGGVGISIHGKYRVASEKTTFAMPETAIGFFADVGGTYFLSRLRDNMGIYLVLTGNRLKGIDTRHVGIATHYVSQSNYKSFEDALCSSTEPLTERKVDEILAKFNENVPNSPGFDTSKIKTIFDPDRLEDIIHLLKADNSEWAQNQLKLLSKMSPTSLKVAVRQLKVGKTLSLKECLELEYQLCLRFTMGSDFVEGVRALLVDKDNKPSWMPKKIEQVDQPTIEWYFSPQKEDDKLVLKESSSKL